MKRAKAETKALALKPLRLPPQVEAPVAGGLRLVVARRGPLPLVALRLCFRAGSGWDPADRLGLSEFTARMLRRGTSHLSADEINEAVEFVGGTLSSSTSEDSLTLSITAPSADLEAMLDVLGALVREPAFPRAEIDAERGRMLAQIANELDDPSSLVDRAMDRALFGGHPYGHETLGLSAHLRAVSEEDLRAFHRRHLSAANGCLVVAGEVDPDQVLAAAERAFRGMSTGPAAEPLPSVPAAPAANRQVVLVDKPEQTQTQVRIAAIGVRRGHPDHHAIVAFNTVLGNGFSSRLMSQIRVRRGLSYGVASHFDTLRAGGSFSISSFTRTETTRELLDVALREVSSMRKAGPKAAELLTGQRYIAGLYPARFETNESLALSLTDQWLNALPADYHEAYRDRLLSVTREQAAAAAARYLFEQDRTIALVGNAAQVVPQLEGLGEVKVLQIPELE